jgi:GT2 family glycosyltransferase
VSTVTLAILVYNRYDLLEPLVRSAEAGTRKPDKYFIVDNGGLLGDVTAHGFPLEKTEVLKPGKNLGTSAAWNAAIEKCGDYTIVTNDDVVMHANTIEALVHAADTTDHMLYYATPGMFGVFLLRRALFDKIGKFDEGFWPAYFEDNDYARRLKVSGVSSLLVLNDGYDHVGSASLKGYSAAQTAQHHINFTRNRDRYIAKWGGLPGEEIYTEPRC